MNMKCVIVLVLAIAVFAEATDYTVGDEMGWMVPPTPDYYQTWASKYNFVVDDGLVFNFQAGMHDITILSKEDFDACNMTNPMFQFVEPVTIWVEDADIPYYFTCSKGQHCAKGQKFTVTYSAPAPSPSPTESASVETRPVRFVLKGRGN